ncbi:MAG TPA: DJ-1/PfpI family protein [Candidatus Dormibacteraeota bacterium]|jgi:putative intracellular protease/amidase|nr:DJ-1/PfpI family protein [Candidatus Dormibacteraeota bacterium]
MSKPVHLYVLEGMADWEVGHAIAELNTASFNPDGRHQVVTVGATADAIRSMGGVTIVPDTTLAELEPRASAMLILPGSGGWDPSGSGGGQAAALALAGRFLAEGVPVAAICGATLGLAHAGLLDSRRHTSSHRGYLAATGYAGGDLYEDARVVVDGDLITAGPTEPLEFAREILRRLEVYPPATLDAWYGLYRTGEASYYFALAGQPQRA